MTLQVNAIALNGVVVPACFNRGDESHAREPDRRASPLMKTFNLGALICFTALCAQFSSAAENFPGRPVRMIIPYAAGGGADIIGRLIAQKLSEDWRQPVIVDNRPGANGIVGTELATRSVPDGHTLLFVAVGHALNLSIEKKLPYDTLKDLAPISLTSSQPIVFVASTGFPVDSMKSLIALAKSQPGKIDFGTSGIGSSPHLAGALLNLMAGITLAHVPYKGAAQATTDAIAGHIPTALVTLTSVLPHIRSGKLKALGITGAQRSPIAPDLPTIAEGGVPGYSASVWNGILVAAATPKPIIARLNLDLVRQLRLPETRERYASLGADVLTSTPEEFDAFLRSEITKWEKVVKAGNMQSN